MADVKPRCPYLAINIPGERPFVVERKLYESVTRGVNIVETTLTKESVYIDRVTYGSSREGKIDGVWVLTIKHHTGRVRGTTRLYNLLQTRYSGALEYRDFKISLADWAARAFKKKSAVAAPTDKHMKQIARLEKELKKLYAHKPVHPLMPRESLKLYTSAGSTAHVAESSDGNRTYALRWKSEKSQRMQLALVGHWAARGKISNAKAYELLEEAGYSVKKYGSLTKNTRIYYRVQNENDYWRHLYLFAYGMAAKRRPPYEPTPLPEQLASHRESLMKFIGAKREIDSIKTQIESIKQLAAMIVPAANETGVVYA